MPLPDTAPGADVAWQASLMDTQPQATGPTESAGPPDLWTTVDALWSWLDADAAHGGREGLLLRVLKLSEEVGEVAQAVIGATGQNPARASPTRVILSCIQIPAGQSALWMPVT